MSDHEETELSENSKVELAKALLAVRSVASAADCARIRSILVSPGAEDGIDRAVHGLSKEDEFALICRLMGRATHLVHLEQRPVIAGDYIVPDFLARFQPGCFVHGRSSSQSRGVRCLVEVKSTANDKFKIGGKNLKRLRAFADQFGLPLIFAVRFLCFEQHALWVMVEDADQAANSLTVPYDGLTTGVRHVLWDDYFYFLPNTLYFKAVYDAASGDKGAAAARVFLWSGFRKLEVAGLTWDMLRVVGDEVHFEVVGKWGIERWFHIPQQLYGELLALCTASPFVFAAYTDQIRRVHAGNAGCLRKIREEFTARNFGGWVYERVKEWPDTHARGRAFLHVFRKTVLQHASRVEDINRQVAADARVGEAVMMTNYVKETDDDLRARSNRTYRRILASLSPEVARRYGHEPPSGATLEQQIEAAVAARDWGRLATLSAHLAQERRPEAG